MLKRFLQQIMARDRHRTCVRSFDWAGQRVAALRPQSLLDVGCGDGSRLFSYLDYRPASFCGVEAAPELRRQAEARGLQVTSIDLNGPWPYPDQTFEVVHSAQVIEHLHNIRLFLQEAFRVLKPGGVAVITSENLTSLLNLGAMTLGYTPFTLMQTCGWYLGNPWGLHHQESLPEHVPITDPAFSGVTGHVRALGVLQAQELLQRLGFIAEVTSCGLMPIPDIVGRHLERFMPRRGHFLLIDARRPRSSADR